MKMEVELPLQILVTTSLSHYANRNDSIINTVNIDEENLLKQKKAITILTT
jgi:hypothetical protein